MPHVTTPKFLSNEEIERQYKGKWIIATNVEDNKGGKIVYWDTDKKRAEQRLKQVMSYSGTGQIVFVRILE